MLARLGLTIFCVTGATQVVENDLAGLAPTDQVMTLFNPEGLNDEEKSEISTAFSKAFDEYAAGFPMKEWSSFISMVETAAKDRASTYKLSPSVTHCDRGAGLSGPSIGGMAAFPGGIVKRFPGFSLSKLIFELSQKIQSPAAAEGASAGPLAMTALAQGAGLVQSLVSSALMVVPPLIPPPVWNNQPLNCVPMVTGHNCFGAILTPITLADFVIADVTDAQLDGVIAEYPSLYKTKIGKTSDAAYHLCFSQYMSMKCASLFPRCAVPQARNEPTPVGRLPMCFTHCVTTLVSCPGFWIEDIMSECTDVSVPPMCTFALFLNVWRAPPQLVDFEDANPVPNECPTLNTAIDASNAGSDYDLYSPKTIAGSPYDMEASAVSVPQA